SLAIAVETDPEVASTIDAVIVSSVRELLLNVEKHADATRAWVSITTTQIEVADDGSGGRISLDRALEAGHFGLALVASRAVEHGGELSFTPREGGGLVVRMTLAATNSRERNRN
ncbi:MAG: hypothetical protein QOF76_4357, partial [Solirubrobacteraceae bacterium]|nr:hypothetical protein [Solirubrobacteraceae bacterium]